MQNPLKYKLLADLIRSMEAEGIRFGTGKQLQIQELLRYLPNDIPLEDLKTYLSPIFAKNKQEQAHFYELFDQSLERVRAFTVAPTTLERQVETDEVAWWRNLIYLLLAGLILYLGWLTWRYFNPVPESTWEFLTIRLERNDTLHVELELRPDTITDISFCDGQKLGEGNLVSYYVDSLQIVFIAKDTFGLETPQICVQLVYAQPPVDTVILEVVVNDSPKEKPKPEFARLELQELPHPHKIEDLLVDPEEQARAQFYHDNAWWVKTLLILLFGTILWAIVQWREKKRRKLIAEIESRDQAPYIWNIQIEDALDIGLNESFRVALRQLRQRRRDEVFKLDIPRTVNATIQNAGLVDFQYKQQTKPPEYLILIDRQNRNDHRAMVYDDLYQSFRKNEVLVDRYFFDGDLRNCYNEIHPWGISLKDLQHQYHDSRLLIISDGYRLLSPMTGKMARWTSIFRSWPNRAILSPIPLEKWGRRERNLSERFQFMPASLDGLKVVLEQFDSLEPKPQEEMLAQVEDAPVESIKIKGSLINSLQTYFPKKLMHWIAACAVYPSLHWDLTLHLGRELSDEEQPLLTLDHLIQLVRLPWFVEGKIPDAAREELLQYLEKEGLETYVRQSLDELLQKAPKPEESSVAYEEYRMNVILNELLFTKDKARKKELEEEFARYLAAGNEPDFVVFKYLNRKENRFDFLVPEGWKKYIYHQGTPFLGLKDWPWAIPLWILLTGFTLGYSPDFQLCDGEIVKYKEQQLCIDENWKWVAQLEFRVLDLIDAGKPEKADSLWNLGSGFLLQRFKNEADTFYKNIGIAFYNKGAKLYNEQFESFLDSGGIPENFVVPDSICKYFEYAASTDSLSAIRRDMSVWSREKGNIIFYEALSRCRGEESFNIAGFIAENKDRAQLLMNQTGVPASVILAQMVRCKLQNEAEFFDVANNPLCIRCHGGRAGAQITVDDNCYEAYKSPEQAYQDYLFTIPKLPTYPQFSGLPISDYQGWAEGLEKSRYSREVNYGQILITIIERYALDQYDKPIDLKTIQFGDQVWTAQNLNINTPNSWCFNDESQNCENYGRLYTWESAQQACSSLGEGWRLPSDADWQALVLAAGGYYDWEKKQNVQSPTDAFDRLTSATGGAMQLTIGGFRTANGTYYDFGINGNYWTSTSASATQAWNFNLNDETNGTVTRVRNPKNWAFSCRCVKGRATSFETPGASAEVEIFEEAGRKGLRQKDGTVIAPAQYSNIEPDRESGLYRVQVSTRGPNQMGYMNAKGELIIPIEYRSLGFSSEGLIRAEKNLYGYLDWEGNTVIDFQFEQASDFRGKMARVTQMIKGKRNSFFIDKNGVCVQDCPEGLAGTGNEALALLRTQISTAILNENYSEAFKLLESYKSNSDFNQANYDSWLAQIYKGMEDQLDAGLNVYNEGLDQLAAQQNTTREATLINLGRDPDLKYTSRLSLGCYQAMVNQSQQAIDNLDYQSAINFLKAAKACEDKPGDDRLLQQMDALRNQITRSILSVQETYQQGNSNIPQQNAQDLDAPNYGSVTDPRDKRSYRTIQIGKQTWLADNMNVALDSSWCYDNNPKNCQTYGRLYTWEAAKEACAGLGGGWHLPNKEEWEVLIDNFGGVSDGKDAYKALIKGGESGFDALLGGNRNSDGEYYLLGEFGFYWSATEKDATNPWYFYFFGVDQSVSRDSYLKSFGQSCRCVKN